MGERVTDPRKQSQASLLAACKIVSALDDGLILPMRWQVCRRLAEELPDCDGLRDEAIHAALSGAKEDRANIAKRLWQRESELPFWQGAKFRILVGLTNDDGPLDGYESEYLVEFADLSDVSCSQILSAFGLSHDG